MNLDEWRTRPLIFVEDVERPVLAEPDLHHFQRVRRLALGAPIVIADGDGAWRPARFAPVPDVEAAVEYEAPSQRPTTVGFTPVKGERPEWVVQKLTELGIDRILPLQTRRSVVRWEGPKAAKHKAKLEIVAREAAMQSRRVRLPTILPVASLDVLDSNPAAVGAATTAVFADPAGAPLDPASERFVLIGPEGGWDPTELAGRETRSLPGGVLRAETAAIAAAVLLIAAS